MGIGTFQQSYFGDSPFGKEISVAMKQRTDQSGFSTPRHLFTYWCLSLGWKTVAIMEEEMIALRWNNHLSTLSQLLYSLREEETLIDATLACDGRLFPAHKFVLSMCSDYFKEMFTSNPCKHPIVFMKDVRSEDMEALLDFMYRGVVHIPQESLSGLLKTAEGLQIRGLGLFAREAASEIPPTSSSERSVVTGALEPSVLMSPERKRPYEMDHSEASLVNFSDGDLDDSILHTPAPAKKVKSSSNNDDSMNTPASIPELPRDSDDMLDLGGNIRIHSSDYFKFRRTNANRYINDLLRYFFPVEVLASSSLTGGECFANKGKGPSNKNQLDPCIIRVITHDAIRNFPNINEKKVRNAIRRKLNTESRIWRSQEKFGIPVRRNYVQRRKSRFESPRALVSIEKSDREKDKGPAMVTPNVTMEKAPSKDHRRSYSSPVQQVQQMSDKDGNKRDGETPTPSSSTSYFARQEKQTPPTRVTEQHQGSNSATPTPVATPSLPSASSSPVTTVDKTFKICHEMVKAEIPSAAQYLPQEYTYPSVMPPHVSQAYLPHHMAAADPTYLRRLEMSQGAPHPATISYTYPHATLPTSESLEPSLHM
ncbi:hypothetical protein SK128_004705 [Halocaridina rubra]|uniref:BTB domain-containing protein n=1 Tax=Halocaridina rubra TaxID=373956 RepID=A0AAN8WUI8_HALRR